MKVLMVVNQLHAGGAEVLAADLARGLAGLGVECSLIALHASSVDGDDLGIPTRGWGEHRGYGSSYARGGGANRLRRGPRDIQNPVLDGRVQGVKSGGQQECQENWHEHLFLERVFTSDLLR
jgi:hypothetical protein